MLELTHMPDVPSSQRIEDVVSLALEDLSQRGLVKLSGLARSLEQVCWHRLLREQPVSRLARASGFQASLSRLIFEGADAPAPAADAKIGARASYQYGHTLGPSGDVDRRLLRLHTELRLAPAPGNAEGTLLGRIHTEHLLTTSTPTTETEAGLNSFDFPDNDGALFDRTPPSQVDAPPRGSRRLEPEAKLGRSVVFGPMHTDPRGRVRSLAFPQIFEEVALERLSALRRDVNVLAREVHLNYRKPCLAGQKVDVVCQAFERDGMLYVVGAFVPEGPDRRPHCYVRMGLR